jgi:hypothetical protein
MEEKLKKKEKAQEEPNIVRDKIEEYKRKFFIYVKRKPKDVFYVMVALTILSIISNVFYYQYTVKNAKVAYTKMNDKIFNKDYTVASNKQDVSISQQASDFFEMKKDLDVLKQLQVKKELTRQDSLEAIRITKKYNLR